MNKRNNVEPCRRIINGIFLFAAGLIVLMILGILACYMPRIRASHEIKDIGFYGATLEEGMQEVEILENVKLVGLGEATHGNSDFQDMKLEMLKMLVEKYGFSAFAMEVGNCDGMKIDRYIRGEINDMTAKEVISDISYPIYNTENIAELIEYMRDYNALVSEEEQLRFYGFDMQSVGYDVECLEKDMQKLAGRLVGEDKKTVYESIQAIVTLKDKDSVPDWETAEKLIADIERLREFIKESSELYEEPADMEDNLHTLTVCKQFLEYYAGAGTREYAEGFSVRDSFMADNLEWMQKREEERREGRILISAHNGHINKKENVFGGYIAEKYGADYYAIGTGFFLSDDNINDSRLLTAEYTRNNHRFCSGDILAYQAKFFEGGRYYLELDKVDIGSGVYNIISNPNYMGYIGEGYSANFYLYPEIYVRNKEILIDIFDSMIYVYHAKPISVL